ncbi:hypothetical protein JOC77_001911 [Peribacillus deserti]|uniref:NERD domain-containing protein n=1 Tax=Peribacillus deserti TaxID=673318 RepID=A0ABS2QH31_9BACI|nr:nuclease-related domain-containing protein [Peribacillus deserti]MBM7692481.1 hypothetical protein [Peribacillus deserti]
MFISLFKRKKDEKESGGNKSIGTRGEKERVALRKGEIGEYKIDIQLAQFPKSYYYLNDILIKNSKSSSGYSQIDHVVFTPYGIFVIETKNYQGTIYGAKERKTWIVNGKFKMMNPLMQNFGHIQALKRLINELYHDYFINVVSFSKRCTLKIEGEVRKVSSNELVIYDIEFTEYIERKIAVLKLQNREPIIREAELLGIYNAISDANITAAQARDIHKTRLQNKQRVNLCVTCNQPVSDKVAAFCRSNKKFNRQIYCYDHQKMI